MDISCDILMKLININWHWIFFISYDILIVLIYNNKYFFRQNNGDNVIKLLCCLFSSTNSSKCFVMMISKRLVTVMISKCLVTKMTSICLVTITTYLPLQRSLLYYVFVPLSTSSDFSISLLILLVIKLCAISCWNNCVIRIT